MTEMEFLSLEKEYNVHVYEMGPDGKLSLYSFFDYLEDIASDHAVSLGYGRDDLMKQNHIWVLSRIYAEIQEWPAWRDKLTVRTWPRGTDRLFALRDFDSNTPLLRCGLMVIPRSYQNSGAGSESPSLVCRSVSRRSLRGPYCGPIK